MRSFLTLLVLATLSCACATPRSTGTEPPLIALSRMEDGCVVLFDASSLAIVRRLSGNPAEAPMLIATDPARRCFYVGNFRGGLGRIPWDGGEPAVLELGGPSIGLALDPLGALLAVNGAHDLRLSLVDLETWSIAAVASLGDASDEPKHSHMTHGLASTHPCFEADGAAIVTQDNVHEELLRVDRAGRVLARLPAPSAIHSLLPRRGGGWYAICEGAVDGSVLPSIAFVRAREFAIEQVVPLALAAEEKAKLHHADVSHDGKRIVAANMGPMHGDGAGRSVHAVDAASGVVRWTAQGPPNAGHVRVLDAERVAVLGHRGGEIAVLDLRDGRRLATWRVAGASSLGHALHLEAGGSLLVVDSSQGRIVRLGAGSTVLASEPLGPGTWEASLRE